MAENIVCVPQQQTKPIKIRKWKVKEGHTISIGRILLLYDFYGQSKDEQRKYKSSHAGTIHKILAEEGAIVRPGEALFELKPCKHPTIMNDMCAECGADLRKDDLETIASIPMVHTIPDLKVSEELALKLGKADSDRLLKDRKLVLLVDLDQTLIHTTNDNIPANIKDVYHFQLYGPNSPWYHTRLRPGTHTFLENVFPFFELHICTFGARNYAHMIAMFLDGDQKFFSNRILSRDECFDPTSKKANLKALFPCGDNMVCIIDDREDVWNNATNLIHVKPYHFFKHTGDINAPPGLDKHEDDDREGVDLTKIKQTKNSVVNGTEGFKNKDVENKRLKEVETNPNILELKPEQVNNANKVNDVKTNVIKEVTNVNESNSDSNLLKNKTNIESPAVVATDSKVEVQNNDDLKNDLSETKIEAENKTISNESSNNIKEKGPNVQNGVEENKSSQEDVKETNENCLQNQDENLIEIEDPDDYLLYLENILKRIHRSFYEEYDKLATGTVPDLKKVIPAVKSSVLTSVKMVFSGLVPTHIKLEHSKAYQVAKSLGAEVTQDIEDGTTHLVAVRPGTAKVNAVKRKKNIKIVTPDWLWSCAERWEHVDERIFPLNSKGSKNRHPPAHCSSPEHITNYPVHDNPALRKRTPSGRFMDTINPLMSFSSDDIADMDKEVEDILDDDSDSSGDEQIKNNQISGPKPNKEDSSSSSSEESLTAEYPRGHKRRRKSNCDEMSDEMNNSTEEESPSVKFRRGGGIDSDLDMGQESCDTDGSIEPPDEVDDGEWNMMGAALEREFLSND